MREKLFSLSDRQKYLIGGSIGVLLLGLIFVGPSFLLSDLSNDLYIDDAPLFTGDGSEVVFDSDTTISTKAEIWIEDSGSIGSAYLVNKTLKYDRSSDRVLIISDPQNTNYSIDTTSLDYQVVARETYYVRSDSGQFEQYTLRQYYDFQQGKFVNSDETGESCQIGKTSYVTHTSQQQSIEGDDRIPSTYVPLGVGGILFNFSEEVTEQTVTVTIEDSTHMSPQPFNSLIRTTESSGEMIATSQQSNKSEYTIHNADIHAEATVFDSISNFPIINYTNPMEATMNYEVTTDQSNEVTVEEPEWVTTYKQECE